MARPDNSPYPSARPSRSGEGRPAPSSPPSQRPKEDHLGPGQSIPIPDFQLLKRVGAGAYGEVWLAQSITGALRAVKIVWREDFEHEKTFHREFEGIQKFEPISRGHPGLVNVLHVGWNEYEGFYYYVMELGDDALKGDVIDLQTYVPRTLSSDFKNHGRLNLDFCRQTGIYMAEALGYMHAYGLTHRDIKPANIIFVKGVCKLADIGLVAAHGERSFVGTEGFVPPEGPGTFAADVFSLGKVLYEISSGKDRMEFPEVPEDLSQGEIVAWREWNEVICRACAPNLKERFESADQFAQALRDIGKPKPKPKFRGLVKHSAQLLLGSFLCGFAAFVAKKQYAWQYAVAAPEQKILTQAERAIAKLPTPRSAWINSMDQRFVWNKHQHEAVGPLPIAIFNSFLDDSGRSFEGEIVAVAAPGNKVMYTVKVPKSDADSFCRWLTQRDRREGTLNGDFEYRWKSDTGLKNEASDQTLWTGLKLYVAPLKFGEVAIVSDPPHAEVILAGQSIGHTPLDLSKVRAGKQSFELQLPGYKRETVEGVVKADQILRVHRKLAKSNLVTFGRNWENSVGLKFLPLGKVLMGEVEITQKVYFDFLRELPVVLAPNQGFVLNADLPMTTLSKQDAANFCKWLTQRERQRGFIDRHHAYRLPTDDEWSMAANLPRERGLSPAERHQRIEGIYPWGFVWPPPKDPLAGNFADASFQKGRKDATRLNNYQDGFAALAPVGTFAANEQGFQDLGGNAWEWVQDQFGGTDLATKKLGVTRGGAWTTGKREELLSSNRRATSVNSRLDDVSFRLVLSKIGVTARSDNEESE